MMEARGKSGQKRPYAGERDSALLLRRYSRPLEERHRGEGKKYDEAAEVARGRKGKEKLNRRRDCRVGLKRGIGGEGGANNGVESKRCMKTG